MNKGEQKAVLIAAAILLNRLPVPVRDMVVREMRKNETGPQTAVITINGVFDRVRAVI
jgi:hypothetical protein